MTPLILSTISGSARVVRMLLFAGANRLLKDNKNRTALYMVEEDPDNINEDIAEMLNRKSGFSEYWNIKPVFKPTNKSPKQVIYYLVLYFTSHLGFFFFNWNLFEDNQKIIIVSTIAVLALITKISFFCAWLRDPGYVKHTK